MTYKKQIIKEMQSLLAQLEEDNKSELKVGDWVKFTGGGIVKLVNGNKYFVQEVCSHRGMVRLSRAWIHSCFAEKTTAPEPKINWNVRPKFEDGELYWYFGTENQMFNCQYSNHPNDLERRKYRTPNEIKWYAEQRKLIIEMEDFIGFDDLDWNDVIQEKCNFIYSWATRQWIYSEVFSATTRGLFPPCPDAYTANKTLDKFKDRLHYLLPYDGRNEK